MHRGVQHVEYIQYNQSNPLSPPTERRVSGRRTALSCSPSPKGTYKAGVFIPLSASRSAQVCGCGGCDRTVTTDPSIIYYGHWSLAPSSAADGGRRSKPCDGERSEERSRKMGDDEQGLAAHGE
ncbi:hypothetical protein VE01_10813 [Pseudogymnoascus verrucosus]|uniref:Uncharacterized protein n=1 Tax=Pseudogymnoascus verrucosus TaxID=342668 RepID=A0A2P6FH02_9PEZI|nr:uncharacterized protein VE01_10813 [Pseudogymnoascus verrucosus]PQM43917.1 hypothetical protein VE01_10813 [Pseudogymnoascus verrucosus]